MKSLKILCIIFVGIALLFVINYCRIVLSYFINKNNYIETYNIQGNKEKYAPQGLTYSEKYNVILQTSYNAENKISKLYVTEFDTGKVIKEIELLKNDGSENRSHVGGIATNNERIWISSDYEINEYSLDEIINSNKTKIKSLKDIALLNRGDFCTYNDNILWIGEFYLKGTPLLMGYNVIEEIDYNTPNYIISIPSMVQGLTITPDKRFIFTRSYSGFINSELCIFENVLNYENNYYELNGKKIQYYKLKNGKLAKKKKIPPMAEGLFWKNKEIYILFESASDQYFSAFPKIDKILKIDDIK